MRNIGEVIRELRIKKGMKLEDLAHKVGTDPGNISRLERGKQSYTDERLRAIAKALSVPVSQLWQMAEGIEPIEDLSKEAAELGRAWDHLPPKEKAAMKAAIHALKEPKDLDQDPPITSSGL